MIHIKKIMYLILFSIVVFSQTTIVSASGNSAEKAKDSSGVVAPTIDADSLSSKELENSLLKIGLSPKSVKKMSLEQKRKAVKDGGIAIKPKVNSAVKVYNSLSGKTIPYTKKNIEKIKKQKLKDLEKYNKETGQSISILELPGNNNILESKNTEELSQMKSSLTTSSIEDQYGVLPATEIQTDGDLLIDIQVIYKGPYGSSSMEYEYANHAIWFEKPVNTKTDAFATAFDVGAVPIKDSFFAQYIQRSSTPDGQSLEIVKKLDPNPEDLQVYGHGVNIPLGDYQQHSVTMTRNVSVSTNRMGETAYILTKYRHAYLKVTGINMSFGPGSISFGGLNWGDDVEVEYNYEYGNVNPWDV